MLENNVQCDSGCHCIACNAGGTLYKITMPSFHQTYLAAFQHNNEIGVHTTFEPDTETCVIDNCANVHIWNDFNASFLVHI